MLKFTKIMIFAIIYSIVNISITLLYGFLIGGYPSVLFYAIIGIISFAFIVFFNKKITKIEKAMFLLIISLTMLLMNQVYLFTNSTFDSNEYTARYYTELYTYEGRSSSIDYGVYFKDPNGNEKFKHLKVIDKYSDGDSVIVEEYPGVFGIEHYILIK